jgi:hypothetical protein
MSREFVRITTQTVYFLDTPERIEIARSALDHAVSGFAVIWSTPSDEHDPGASMSGQRLVRQIESEPAPDAGAQPSEGSQNDRVAEQPSQ